MVSFIDCNLFILSIQSCVWRHLFHCLLKFLLCLKTGSWQLSLLWEVQGSQTLSCAHLRGEMLMCLFSAISQQSPLQLKYRKIQSERNLQMQVEFGDKLPVSGQVDHRSPMTGDQFCLNNYWTGDLQPQGRRQVYMPTWGFHIFLSSLATLSKSVCVCLCVFVCVSLSP